MERVTEYLQADHERLNLLLALACAGDEVNHVAFGVFRAGLLRHIAIEEKLLFPHVEDRARTLRADHAAIATMLATTPDLARCGDLAELLGRHDAKEEGAHGIYAACEQVLGAARSHELAERARAFPAVRVAPYRDHLIALAGGVRARQG